MTQIDRNHRGSARGPLVGVEFGVAAFINPLIARLPDAGFRAVRSGGADCSERVDAVLVRRLRWWRSSIAAVRARQRA